MSELGGFSPGYHPAGASEAYKRRAQRRRAGLASVAARRRLSRAAPRKRYRNRELALAAAIPPPRQLPRADFDRLYLQTFPASDTRGLNTAWTLYAALWARCRACGPDFELTNEQLSRALSSRGRPRARRTVQLTRKRLEAMGLWHFAWIQRGAWTPAGGYTRGRYADTVRATALHANCTLLREQERRSSAPLFVPAVKRQRQNTCSVPPPTAADCQAPPCGGEQHSTKNGELEPFELLWSRALGGEQLTLAEVERIDAARQKDGL